MSGTSHRIALATCALACAFWLGACAWIEGSTGPVEGTIGEQAVSMTATVEKIDLATRQVTLRGKDGKVATVTVSEAAKNLPQVKVGDLVNVAFYESLVYEVKKPGEAQPGVNVLDTAVTAKPGEKPAAMAGEAVTVTSTIEAIDHDTPAVTLKGPEGNLVTVKVRDREKLARVKVGDLVEITYTRAMAVSVEPAK